MGATLLFLGFDPESSFSLSLWSLLVPATLPAVLRGVSGGVAIGTPVTLPEFVAVKPGTLPATRVGGPGGAAVELWVMTDEVELDRVGDDGRWLAKAAAGGGEGAAKELVESRCRCCDPLGKGDGGANCEVGVGTGVFCDEVATTSALS